MLKTGNKAAFTLFEVLIASAVLSLGSLLIYEAFFSSLDIINYCEDYLSAAIAADEKLWEAQNELTRFGALTQEPCGAFTLKGKRFSWDMSCGLIDDEQGLYKVDFAVFLRRGDRDIKISRVAYARYSVQQ